MASTGFVRQGFDAGGPDKGRQIVGAPDQGRENSGERMYPGRNLVRRAEDEYPGALYAGRAVFDYGEGEGAEVGDGPRVIGEG
jgi:hypothetical protein